MQQDLTFFDDGLIGMSIERHGATVRLFEKPAHTGRPPYITTGHLHRWTRRCVLLGGFHGRLTMRHQALIVKALHQQGFRHLFIERGDHAELVRSPMFAPCLYGPLDDLLICRLDDAVEYANQRYPATYIRPGAA